MSKAAFRPVGITGTGISIPDQVLTNHDLEKMVDTSDAWITSRTGIKERRVSAKDQPTSELACAAAKQALSAADLGVKEVDLIIVATITPDKPWPATAAIVQDKLNIRECMAFDLSAACTGFLYSLEVAQRMLSSGFYRNALLIGADELTNITDWEDRSTCVLFGDGAGAMVLEPMRDGAHEILGCKMGCDGTQQELLHQPGGGTLHPPSRAMLDARLQYLKMAGGDVFKHATRRMSEVCTELLGELNLTIADIHQVVPHQANLRIIDALARRLDIPMEKVFVNVHKYGNMSAATVPIALHEAKQHFHAGDLILSVAFGGGLTWGASVIRW